MYINSQYHNSYRRRKRRKRRKILSSLIFFLILLTLILSSVLIYNKFFKKNKHVSHKQDTNIENIENNQEQNLNENTKNITKSIEEQTSLSIENQNETNNIIEKSKRLAASYDYDLAIENLKKIPNYEEQEEINALIKEFEEAKTKLVKYDINKVAHVFFHTLIVDTTKAFDQDSKSAGYNQVMTTIDEFKKILQSMYDRGFVLVRMHDMAYEIEDENKNKKMQEADIMLPEGKKAFVMSQDDVCYYEYMVGDGFASRLIIDENNKVTTEMDMDDGSKKIGSYDLIPILNDFIDEHPDFSYKGAKAIIAVTGYNGVFGYRTDKSYEGKNPNIEEDRQKVRDIAKALKDDGFELSSHSWGHRHLGRISFNEFKTDTDKWEENVESLIGETDILLYPFGTDVSDWHPYVDSNERYKYLYNKGFRYFCTVDSNKYWVQLGDKYLRQGRRNLDGYRMWRDLTEPDNPKLSDLFDVKEVFDKNRPTPVGVIRS